MDCRPRTERALRGLLEHLRPALKTLLTVVDGRFAGAAKICPTRGIVLNREYKRGRKADEVFGVSNEVLPLSYVDRGNLDEELARYLGRKVHIALHGPSKSGKSWLRQHNIPDAIVVQCRLGKTVDDVYREALGALGINLIISKKTGSSLTGRVEATAEFGQVLIAKVATTLGLSGSRSSEVESKPLSQDITDLNFVAGLILQSERRLVIEDVHYLSQDERVRLAYDLKALWDYGVFVIIVGVWKQQSLIDLNSDLSTRVKDLSVAWSETDLKRILEKGSRALHASFSPELESELTRAAYGNAGLLQTLALGVMDESRFKSAGNEEFLISDLNALSNAAMEHAESLNTLYQSFAKRVSKGIRSRKNSTGIYAHAMAVILEQDDKDLIKGVPLKEIFVLAHQREPRILLPNLRTVLKKIDGLQTDKDGRGLVLSYNESNSEVTVVDLQLLLYRRYATVSWPWDSILEDVSKDDDAFGGETDAATD